jgi:hypothetical protein
MAEVPENPGSQGSPEPPPFQPVAAQYQPVPAPNPGAAPGPVSPFPEAPKKSGGALKIILIIVGVLVLLVLLVVGAIGFFVYRIAHSAHVGKDGSVTLSTPGGGTFSSNQNEKFTSADLGTDIYPGAVPNKVGNMRVSMPSASVVSASYLTSDSKDQVVNFYKGKLGDEATSMDMGASSIVSLKKGSKEQITVTIAQEASRYDGKTQIHIMHTTDKEAK